MNRAGLEFRTVVYELPDSAPEVSLPYRGGHLVPSRILIELRWYASSGRLGARLQRVAEPGRGLRQGTSGPMGPNALNDAQPASAAPPEPRPASVIVVVHRGQVRPSLADGLHVSAPKSRPSPGLIPRGSVGQGDHQFMATAVHFHGLPPRRLPNSPRVLHPLRHFPWPWILARQEQVHRKPRAF